MKASLRCLLVTTLAVAALSAELAPYYPREKYKARGYLVSFREGHTLQRHLERAPDLRGVEISDSPFDRGYFAELTNDQLRAVRLDSGVERVEDSSYGEFLDQPSPESANVTLGVFANVASAAVGLWRYTGIGRSQSRAVYHPSPGSTTPWRHYVVFHSDHTLRKHYENVGEDLGVFYQGGFYSGTLTDEQRKRVLGDPGVKSVSQYSGSGEWC